MKKLVLVVVLLALGVAAGVVGYRRVLAREHEPARGTLRVFGNVELREVRLAFLAEERVSAVHVEEGARVEAGELLATLRTERLQAERKAQRARVAAQQAEVDELRHGTRPEELEQARAALEAARVRAQNSAREIARLERSTESGATSAQALDDARARLAVEQAEQRVREQALALAEQGPRAEQIARAKASLAAAQAEGELLDTRLADSELRAPSAGVIRSRLLEVGDLASPQRAAFTLALAEPKWIRAWVPEPELARVAEGMRAVVYADALDGSRWEGWVGYVSPVAEFTPKAVETEELRTKLVYELRVYVHDPRDELRLGMPVTVEVDSEGGREHAPRAAPAASETQEAR